jgi:hypothetical protein
MKIFKLIGVIAVIGIGLWGSIVHAQNLRSRTVDLVRAGGDAFNNGRLVINRDELGANSNRSFVPDDGEAHPSMTLHVQLRCQSALDGDFLGPRQFYVLYIEPDTWEEVRILTFNPHCKSFVDTFASRLPETSLMGAIDPDLWFEEDLHVRVALEADDDDTLHGDDSFSLDVMEGDTP